MEKRQLIRIQRQFRWAWHRYRMNFKKYATRTLIFAGATLFFWFSPIHFHVSFGKKNQENEFFGLNSEKNVHSASFISLDEKEKNTILGLNLANEATAVSNTLTTEQKELAAKFSNLGFLLSPDAAQKHSVSKEIVQYKKQKCLDYIKRFLPTAKQEAELYNIPVSITLAQALLESNAGDSQLAIKENNHFGIKCGGCTTCKCAQYTDDSPKDMFRVFESPWYSFREHSKLLQNKRYKHLLQLPRSDYKNWAYGLQAAGYATDKKYAEKLIKIVENLGLQKLEFGNT